MSRPIKVATVKAEKPHEDCFCQACTDMSDIELNQYAYEYMEKLRAQNGIPVRSEDS